MLCSVKGVLMAATNFFEKQSAKSWKRWKDAKLAAIKKKIAQAVKTSATKSAHVSTDNSKLLRQMSMQRNRSLMKEKEGEGHKEKEKSKGGERVHPGAYEGD